MSQGLKFWGGGEQYGGAEIWGCVRPPPSDMPEQFPLIKRIAYLIDKTLGALIPQFINHVLFFVGIHEI